MNARFFRFDFTNETIVGSQTAIKRASNPASNEFKELIKMQKMQPTFKISAKDVKRAVGKTTYKGITADFIKNYIAVQPGAEELQKQYDKAYELGKFPQVRKWFLATFENLDMEKASREIEVAKLSLIKKAA